MMMVRILFNYGLPVASPVSACRSLRKNLRSFQTTGCLLNTVVANLAVLFGFWPGINYVFSKRAFLLTHCTGVFMLLDNECNPQCIYDYWEFDKARYHPQQYFLLKVCLQDLLRMKTLTILVMVTQYCKKICLWI